MYTVNGLFYMYSVCTYISGSSLFPKTVFYMYYCTVYQYNYMCSMYMYVCSLYTATLPTCMEAELCTVGTQGSVISVSHCL